MRSGKRPLPRSDEFLLTLLAAMVAVIGVWVVSLSNRQFVTIEWLDIRQGALLGLVVLSVAAFWSVSRFSGDQIILPLVALLATIGYVMLLRLQPDLTALDSRFSRLSSRQGLYIGAGFLVLACVARFFRHWHLLKRYRYTLLFVCIGLLFITFVFGTPVNGARLWISAGPIQVQPSEIIKIGLVLFLASYLDDYKELIGSTWKVGPLRLPPIPYLLPMAIMWGTSLVVLVVENDLGSALLLFGIFLVMVYAGTGRPVYVLVGLVSFGAACWLALTLFDRIGIRVQNWLDPWRDPLDTGYQQIQSDFAIASGGVLGAGLNRGEPWRIPAVETDFIYSAIGEEFGLLGALAVLALFGVLVARGFSIALRARDTYLRLVAIGLSASLGIQTAVILCGVLRLTPLTGITLPFISYGGSSMLTNFLIIGLLANISAQTPLGSTGGRR